MGNCCVRHGYDSNMVWAGDDWGSPMSERFVTRGGGGGKGRYDGYYSDEKQKKMIKRKKTDQYNYHEAEEKKEICAEQRSALLVVDDEKNVMMNSSSTEVKVRITKRQLEELLGNVEVKGLTVQELLEQLMNVNTSTTIITTRDSTTRFHRSWRPALNTIPEMIEAN